MNKEHKISSYDDYFNTLPIDVQNVLRKVQDIVEAALPNSQRCISYSIPAYCNENNRIFFYFAGFKKHLGIYPPLKEDLELIHELKPYRNEKGNLAFKFKETIPYSLIERVAVALFKQHAES